MRGSLIVIAGGRILQIIVSLLAVRVFTSLLSASEVGNLYLINSILALFGLALLNPVGMYFYRKLNRWVEEGEFWNRFLLFTAYIALVAFTSSFVVLFMQKVLGVGGGIDLSMLVLFVMAYLFFNTWNQTSIALLNFLDHRISFVLLSLATSVGGLFCAAFLVNRYPSALVWLSGLLAAQAMLTFAALAWLAKAVRPTFHYQAVSAVVTPENVGQIFRFILPLAFTTLLTWTQTQSYRLIVEQRIGLEFLGQIGLGLSIAANIAAAVESIVHQAYMPVFYREINSTDHDVRTAACNRMFQMTIPLYLGLSLFVSCLAPFLVSILAHGKFAGAFIFVIFGAWIELFRMITGILSTAAHSEMQTGYLVRAYLWGGLLAIIGVVAATFGSRHDLLIPSALLVSGIVTMAVMYRQMHRIIRVKVGIRTIIRAGLLSVPFALASLFYGFRDNIIVSLAVTALFGVYFLLSQYFVYRRFVVMEHTAAQ